MRDLFDNVPLVVILFVAVSIIRAIANAMGKKPADAGEAEDESEDQRRVREIQERIRRLAAERSGQREVAAPPPLVRTPEPPPATLFHPRPLAPIDTFGGPARPALEEIGRRFQSTGQPVAIPQISIAAEVERQNELSEQLRALEEKRLLAKRHADQAATEKKQKAESEGGLLVDSRSRLLGDLQDPASLRRAFVQREVLGPPLALR